MPRRSQRPSVESLDPKAIFEECRAREMRVLQSFRGLRVSLYKLLFIDNPVFPKSTTTVPNANKLNKRKRHSLESALLGTRSREVLHSLKRCRDIEERWDILAWWLKQERVCEPEDILPFSITRLANWRLKGFSQKDTVYASSVEVWGPYFELLRTALRGATELTRAQRNSLLNEGYDPGSITNALTHAAAIPAICSWLQERNILPGQPDARTIRNAHSRWFGRHFRKTSFFNKSTRP